MRKLAKERGSHIPSVVVLLGLIQFTTAGCIPLFIVENTVTRGRTTPVPFDQELAIANDLEVYKTSNKKSFSGAIGSYSGGRNTVPYGDYFLTKLSIELKDKNVTELTLENSNLACDHDDWLAPKQICDFSGIIKYKINNSSLEKEFKFSKINLGPSWVYKSHVVASLKNFLEAKIIAIASGMPAAKNNAN